MDRPWQWRTEYEGISADAADLRTRNAALNRMVCEDCGTVYYSAAARTMVERGERCPKCGGRLILANGPRPLGPRERSDPRPKV
jgi:DNA-directed RNA polymerase subunit RPC12/RpoP